MKIKLILIISILGLYSLYAETVEMPASKFSDVRAKKDICYADFATDFKADKIYKYSNNLYYYTGNSFQVRRRINVTDTTDDYNTRFFSTIYYSDVNNDHDDYYENHSIQENGLDNITNPYWWTVPLTSATTYIKFRARGKYYKYSGGGYWRTTGDVTGNRITVKRDNSAPTFNLTSFSENVWINSDSLTISAYNFSDTSGIAESYWVVNNNIQPTSNTLTLYEGTHSIYFHAKDNLGQATTPDIKTVNIDNTAPSFNKGTIIDDVNNCWTNETSKSFSVSNIVEETSGIASKEWFVFEGEVSTFNSQLTSSYYLNDTTDLNSSTITLTTDNLNNNQVYSVFFRATDKAEKISEAEFMGYLGFDTTNPAINNPIFVGYEKVDETLYAKFTWEKTTNDGGSPVQNLYSTTPSTTSSSNNNIYIPIGNSWGSTFSVSCRVTDSAGNSSETKTVQVTIPNKIYFATDTDTTKAYIAGDMSYDNGRVVYPVDLFFDTNTNIVGNVTYSINVTDSEKNTIFNQNFSGLSSTDNTNVYKKSLQLSNDFLTGGENLTYTVKAVYDKEGDGVSPITLYLNTISRILGRLGSQPELSISTTETTNSHGELYLEEEYSEIDQDIDNFSVSYELQVTTDGPENYKTVFYTGANNPERSIKTIQISSIRESEDEDSPMVVDLTGEYTFRIVPDYGAVSDPVVFSYDITKPSTPTISSYPAYTNSNSIDVTFGTPTDNIGVSHIEYWFEYGVSSSTPSPIYVYNTSVTLTLPSVANGDSVYLKAKTVDSAGNKSETPISREITFDNGSPSLTANSSYTHSSSPNTIIFNLESSEDVYYSLDNDSLSGTLSRSFSKSIDATNLNPNAPVTLSYTLVDRAGNETTSTYTGYTKDTIDVTTDDFSQIIDSGVRYIVIEFLTTQDKYTRYTINDITEENTSTLSQSFYDQENGKAIYKFAYTELQEYQFKVEVTNQNGDISETNLSFEPQNNAPAFPADYAASQITGDYLKQTGILTWPEANDEDTGDTLTYEVEIKGSSDETATVYTDILTNTKSLGTLLGKTPKDDEIYTWTVKVSDLSGATDTIGPFTFKLDNNKPVVTIQQTTHGRLQYSTTALNFTITDEESEGKLNSGLNEVKITIDDIVTTFSGDDLSSDGIYTINLSNLTTGEHSIQVVATDNAGNIEGSTDFSFSYDKDYPVISSITPGIERDNSTGKYLNKNSTFNVALSLSDAGSGIVDISYKFDANNSTTDSGWVDIDMSNSSAITSGTRSITIDWPGTDNESKYLFVKVADDAGNITRQLTSSTQIYTDTRNPVYESHEISSPNLYSGLYLTSLEGLTISPVFKLENSLVPTSDMKYILTDALGNLKTLKAKGLNINTSLTLDEGSTYTLTVIAYNQANKSIPQNIGAFIYDNSDPITPQINLPNRDSFSAGEVLNIGLSANDTSSGISHAEIKIGSSEGNTDISGGIISVDNSWVKNSTTYTNDYNCTLPDTITDGTYYIDVTYFDGVGKSVTSDNTFTIDNTVPRVNIHLPEYTTVADNNSFTWSLINPGEIIGVRYSISTDGNGSMQEVSNYESTNVVNISETLSLGIPYTVIIEVDMEGEASPLSSSSTITFDNTKPVENRDDSFAWPLYSQSSLITVNWDISEEESGIRSIQHKIEAFREDPDNDNQMAWIKIYPVDEDWAYVDHLSESGTGSITFSPDVSQGERIKISRSVINEAGLQTDRVSPEITIDNTVPSQLTGIVDYVNYMKSSSETDDEPTVSWLGTESDEDSDMTYYWTFKDSTSNPESIPDAHWTLGNETKRASYSGTTTNGDTMYFIIKGVNGSGMVTYGFSDGITFDDEAPDHLSAKLVQSGSNTHIYYLTDEEDLKLMVEARDNNEGQITYTADYGIANPDGSYKRIGSFELSGESNTETNSLLTTVPRSLLLNDELSGLILFRVWATDEAGNITDEGYTPGTIYDNTNPTVSNAQHSISSNSINVFWDATPGGSSIKEYSVSLTGATEYDYTSTNKQYVIDTTNIPPGEYSISIVAISESGLESASAVISNITIDNSKPVISSDITIKQYAYIDLTPQISYTEYGTYLTKYSYAIGTLEDDDVLTGSWVEVVESHNGGSGMINPSVNMFDFAGYHNLNNPETLYLSIKAMDAAGNWSDIVRSSSFILDNDLADTTISVPDSNIFNTSNRIEGISFHAIDSESGLVQTESEHIQVKLTLQQKNGDEYEDKQHEIKNISDYIETDELSVVNSTFTGLTLEDATDYRLAIQVKNGTGVYSEPSYSDVFRIDLTEPEFSFNGFTKYKVEDHSTPIFNNSGVSGDEVFYSVNEDAKVVFELFKEGNNTTVHTSEAIDYEKDTDGIYIFNHNYNNESEAYGDYILKATVTDTAGNVSTYLEYETDNTLAIRYNKPPTITFNKSYYTTPGKPFTLDGISVVDSDGDVSSDYPITYEWTIAVDGDDIDDSTKLNPRVSFYHNNPTISDETTYTIMLKASDNNGKSATTSHTVVVHNTSSGALYTNEYWMGNHSVTGNITVPSSVILQVNEDANISFTGNSGLTVKGTLNVLSGSQFTKGVDIFDNWAGIAIDSGGSGSFNGTSAKMITVEKATRGVAVINSGTLSLDNVLVDNNIIGIHAYNSYPIITNCTITNNTAYGIKEDLISEPVQPNNTTIENNTINHYHTDGSME